MDGRGYSGQGHALGDPGGRCDSCSVAWRHVNVGLNTGGPLSAYWANITPACVDQLFPLPDGALFGPPPQEMAIMAEGEQGVGVLA